MSNQASTTTEGKTPESVTPGSVTLKEATEAYLEHLAGGGGAKPTTITVYQRALQLAVDFFGADRKLDSILLAQVGKYFVSDALNKHSHNGKPKAQPTVKQNKRVFRQMMEYAQTKGWISTLMIPKAEMQHARQKGNQSEAETPKPVDTPAEAETQE
jgi:site-specific recombinase XerD